jgi:hypothetical protein
MMSTYHTFGLTARSLFVWGERVGVLGCDGWELSFLGSHQSFSPLVTANGWKDWRPQGTECELHERRESVQQL